MARGIRNSKIFRNRERKRHVLSAQAHARLLQRQFSKGSRHFNKGDVPLWKVCPVLLSNNFVTSVKSRTKLSAFAAARSLAERERGLR